MRVEFNQEINFDTTNVTSMAKMFAKATNFNKPITFTYIPKDISYMFSEAINFNQDISTWNTSDVTNMSYMFDNATSLNQDITDWNVDSSTNLLSMFLDASEMIGNYGNISTFGNASNNFTPSYMFFNNVTSLTNNNNSNTNIYTVVSQWYSDPNAAQFIDRNNVPFLETIDNWNTSQVTNMSKLFYNKLFFNDDISKMEHIECNCMSFMFSTINNVDISNNVYPINFFNKYIGNWNTSKVQKYGIYVC